MKQLKVVLPAIFLLLVFVTGCATNTEFSSFAKAGGGYAVAVDNLLFAAGSAQVDSTSWRLIKAKDVRGAGLPAEQYATVNDEDLARLHEIGRLSRHAKLLGQYFGLLESLASSDAPERTEAAIGGVISALEGINLQLPQGVEALPAIGKVAVTFRIRAALKDELEARKNIIQKELQIQEELLKKLSSEIQHALNDNKEIMESALVRAPLEANAPLKDPEKWVAMRHRIIYLAITVQEVGAASETATKLREAFTGLLSGEITAGRLAALLTDIRGMLAIAETIKS